MSTVAPPPAPTEGKKVLSYLQTLVGWLRKSRVQGGKGISLIQTEGGIVLNIQDDPYPWEITSLGTGITLHPGTVSGLLPTNIFSEFAITGTGEEYVVLTGSATANSPSSCTLSIESSTPVPSTTTASTPPSTFADLIGVVADGTVYQIRSKNLTAYTEKVFDEPVTAPAVGEYNLIPYYRWVVSEEVNPQGV